MPENIAISFIVDRIEVRSVINFQHVKQQNFPEKNINSKINEQICEDVFYFPILEFSIWCYLTDVSSLEFDQPEKGHKFILGYWGLVNVDKHIYRQVN